jgi:hypothetical protein
MTKVKTKRITLDVPEQIDLIKDKLAADSGVKMTYVQVFAFLVHFYIKHCNEPRTQWRPMQ